MTSTFCDATTERVIGVRKFLARLRVDSAIGQQYQAKVSLYKPDQKELWQQEIARLKLAQQWVENHPDDHQAVRKNLSQLPLFERPLRKLFIGEVLQDNELFELKRFCYFARLLVTQAHELLQAWDLPDHWADDLLSWMHTIHPEREPSPRFHLSDELDPTLKKLRQKVRTLKKTMRDAMAELEAPSDELLEEIAALEEKVHTQEELLRERLSTEMQPHAQPLTRIRKMLGKLDTRLAKVRLLHELQGCWGNWHDTPTLNIEHGEEPATQQRLAIREQTIQAVDFHADHHPSVITGPNMGGKSVLLQLIGICQWCAQHAMPIPARAFEFSPVSAIIYVGSEASDMETTQQEGLSSFGREVHRLATFWHTPESPRRWLLDEVGRGTHPEEGALIAKEITEKLTQKGDHVIIASHFPLVTEIQNAQCWRIKGLTTDLDHLRTLIAEHQDTHDTTTDLETLLRDVIDHRPIPSTSAEVPRDARIIAKALGLELE